MVYSKQEERVVIVQRAWYIIDSPDSARDSYQKLKLKLRSREDHDCINLYRHVIHDHDQNLTQFNVGDARGCDWMDRVRSPEQRPGRTRPQQQLL